MAEEELILAIRTERLFGERKFQGLEVGGAHFLKLIFDPRNTQYIARSAAEQDPSWKQIIPYVVLHWQGQVLVYTRGRRSGEQRLVAQRSIGLGGHIRHSDESFFAAAGLEAYHVAVQREVHEEVVLAPELVVRDRMVGVINDDSIEVGKVHFGVVHIWDLLQPEVGRREAKINSPHFEPISELAGSDVAGFETWSQFCIQHWSELTANSGWTPMPASTTTEVRSAS